MPPVLPALASIRVLLWKGGRAHRCTGQDTTGKTQEERLETVPEGETSAWQDWAPVAASDFFATDISSHKISRLYAGYETLTLQRSHPHRRKVASQ